MDDRRHAVVAADLLDERLVVDVALDERRAEHGIGAAELERVEHDDRRAPPSRSARTVCEPMYPAPPVTRTAAFSGMAAQATGGVDGPVAGSQAWWAASHGVHLMQVPGVTNSSSIFC